MSNHYTESIKKATSEPPTGQAAVNVSAPPSNEKPSNGDHPDERPERPYYCHHCHRNEHGSYIPAGWYLVRRATGHGGKHLRLGLYCTLPCLMSSHLRLQTGHEVHAGRLGLPDDELQSVADLLERAIHLLHDSQLSVRQVGDVLDIPTDVLRKWLRAANIYIDDSGRLPDRHLPDQRQQEPSRTVARFISERTGKTPLSTVNELEQAGLIRDVSRGRVATTGPSHQPTFETTISAIRSDNKAQVTTNGNASTKKAARAAAAANLLALLSDLSE